MSLERGRDAERGAGCRGGRGKGSAAPSELREGRAGGGGHGPAAAAAALDLIQPLDPGVPRALSCVSSLRIRRADGALAVLLDGGCGSRSPRPVTMVASQLRLTTEIWRSC